MAWGWPWRQLLWLPVHGLCGWLLRLVGPQPVRLLLRRPWRLQELLLELPPCGGGKLTRSMLLLVLLLLLLSGMLLPWASRSRGSSAGRCCRHHARDNLLHGLRWHRLVKCRGTRVLQLARLSIVLLLISLLLLLLLLRRRVLAKHSGSRLWVLLVPGRRSRRLRLLHCIWVLLLQWALTEWLAAVLAERRGHKR